MGMFWVSTSRLARLSLVTGGMLCLASVAGMNTALAQDAETVTPAAVKEDGVQAPLTGPASGLEDETSPVASELQAIVDANTDPQTLAVELADAITAGCASGFCSDYVAAALELAAAPLPNGDPNSAAADIGIALGQVAEASRESFPEFTDAVEEQVNLLIQECSESDSDMGGCGAVAAYSAQGQTGDAVNTATTGEAGSAT